MASSAATGPAGLVLLLERMAWLMLAPLLTAVVLLPAVLANVKAVLAVGLVVFFAALLWAKRGRSGVAEPVLHWFVFYLALGAGCVLLGLLQHAPGAVEGIRGFVLAPLLFLVVTGLIRSGTWWRVELILGLSTLLVSVLVILRMLAIFGAEVPLLSPLVELYPADGFASEGGSTPRVLSTLLFLGPYAVARLMIEARHGFSRRLLLRSVTALVAVVAVLLSMRNAILVATAILPLVLLLLVAVARPRRLGGIVRRSLPVFLLGVLLVVIAGRGVTGLSNWEPTRTARAVQAAFDPQREQGARARLEQVGRLLDSAAASPLWGHGLGSQAGTYVRDPARPWRYEIRYLSLAHATGFLGLGLFGTGVVWTYWRGLRLVRSGSRQGWRILVMLAVLACVLLAEWTNTYLGETGNLWMLFLPIASVNTALMAERESAS